MDERLFPFLAPSPCPQLTLRAYQRCVSALAEEFDFRDLCARSRPIFWKV